MYTLENHPVDAPTAATVHEFLKRVCAAFPVRSVILFGSRARGDFEHDSDADVVVLLSGPRGNYMATMLEMSDIAFDVLLETSIRVEALPIWEDEWVNREAFRNPHLLRNIERDGVVFL